MGSRLRLGPTSRSTTRRMSWATPRSMRRGTPMLPWWWWGTTDLRTGHGAPLVIYPDGRERSLRCPQRWARKPRPRKYLICQEQLVRQVFAVNPKTVVILISSFPFAINWTRARAAIMHMTHTSQHDVMRWPGYFFGSPTRQPSGRDCEVARPAAADMDYNIRDRYTYMYFKESRSIRLGLG